MMKSKVGSALRGALGCALAAIMSCGAGMQKHYHMPQDAAGRSCVANCESQQIQCPVACLQQHPMNFQNGMDTNNLGRQLCMNGCSGNYDSCVVGCGASIEELPAGQVATGGSTPASGSAATGDLGVGDRVSCNWKGGGSYYDGRVGELRPGGRVFINYDDGDVEETSPGMCRVLSKAGGAPSGGSTAASRGDSSSTSGGLAAGDRVSCNWRAGGTFYDGRVGELRPGGRVFINYDDGDVEETNPGMCRVLSKAGDAPSGGSTGGLSTGDRVSCNWKAGGTFYNGRIAQLRAGGRIFIQYDDGDVEETTPNMCRRL